MSSVLFRRIFKENFEITIESKIGKSAKSRQKTLEVRRKEKC
jgi:hypothetical protein